MFYAVFLWPVQGRTSLIFYFKHGQIAAQAHIDPAEAHP
jgi:hypothetical protein